MKNFSLLLIGSVLFMTSCYKHDLEISEVHSIVTFSDVGMNTAKVTVTGNLFSNTAADNWGIAYGKNSDQSYEDITLMSGKGGNAVTFTQVLEDLDTNTTYYVQAFAQFSTGEPHYSKERLSFTTSPFTPVIGELGPGGGLVFYIDSNGGGMEVSVQDRNGSWVNSSPFLPECSPDFGTGEANTALIANSTPVSYAVPYICQNLYLGGTNDWFLPSKDELDSIYVNLCVPGHWDALSGYYWTSSQSLTEPERCWMQNLTDGDQVTGMKNGDRWYLVVRGF